MQESLESLSANQESQPIEDDEVEQESNIVQIENFQSSELHRNHLIQTLQSLQYIKTLPPAS